MAVTILAHAADVSGFRRAVRILLAHAVPPERALFRIAGETPDLFAQAQDGDGQPGDKVAPDPAPESAILLPRPFAEAIAALVCHRDPNRFALGYRLIWRFVRNRALVSDAMDTDMTRLTALSHAVRRDVHKMIAFVRFREVATPEGPLFGAWFEPDHYIEERAAPFFRDRFAAQDFVIVTPRRTIACHGGRLRFGPGGTRVDQPAADDFVGLWRTYFGAIFNPARLHPHAMRREMPKKYWANLDETALIPALLAAAPARAAAMVAAAPTGPAAHHRLRTERAIRAVWAEGSSLEEARTAAAACRLCPLGCNGTTTVFGAGPASAAIMVVGEQPCDQEERAGRPFIGPAGAVFDRACAEAGVARERLYVTNAVKHVKFLSRGKRRLQRTPTADEVDTCRPWLEVEHRLIRPQVVVALGRTALTALLGRRLGSGEEAPSQAALADGTPVMAAPNPRRILRHRTPAQKAAAYAELVAVLQRAGDEVETDATARAAAALCNVSAT